MDETKWVNGPGGIDTRERKADPPRTRALEVRSGGARPRVIVNDSGERRTYERAGRQQAMERARQRLEQLKERVASGAVKRPEAIGAAVERMMQKYQGYRDFDWKLTAGVLEFSEGAERLGREERREGKYVVMTREKGPGIPERRGPTGGGPDARLVRKARKLADQRPPVPPAGEETVFE